MPHATHHDPPHRPQRGRRLLPLAAAVAAVAALALPATVGSAGSGHEWLDFERVEPEFVSPSGNSVATDCPGDPDGWPEATLSARVHQRDGATRVRVDLSDARPDTYYTIWLRLGGMDSNGEAYGRNPVTGGRATPMSASGDLDELLAATGTGNGTDNLSNGFRTDAQGDAELRTMLDFPLIGGAYPFQRFPNWDVDDVRLPATSPAIYPVAIAGPQGPYTLRVVSHCTDDVGHGLTSGPREIWFDWKLDA